MAYPICFFRALVFLVNRLEIIVQVVLECFRSSILPFPGFSEGGH